MERIDVIFDKIESVYDEMERYIDLHHYVFTLQVDEDMKRFYDKVDKLRSEYYKLLLEDDRSREIIRSITENHVGFLDVHEDWFRVSVRENKKIWGRLYVVK